MRKLLNLQTVVMTVLVVAAATGVGTGAFFYLQYRETQNLLQSPTLSGQVEAQVLVDRIGRLMDLPKNEQPTIATVTDVNKLKGQEFFRQAKNGYKLLIYTTAKKAILYDPAQNKIIDVAPVNIGQSDAVGLTGTGKPAQLKVAIYNGTNTAGLTGSLEKTLKLKTSALLVTAKQNAQRNDYTKTIVTDLTGKHLTEAKTIADWLGGEVGALPEGEPKPATTDIVIIAGKQ